MWLKDEEHLHEGVLRHGTGHLERREASWEVSAGQGKDLMMERMDLKHTIRQSERQAEKPDWKTGNIVPATSQHLWDSQRFTC